MRLVHITIAALFLAASSNAEACPPPSVSVPWADQVASAYNRSQTVFVARVVREETLRGNGDEETSRSFLKPTRFFKGDSSQAPRYVDKELRNTCDQRPFARLESEVLVFVSAQGELLRATPEQDRDDAVSMRYASAMRQVEELSRAKKL
jgi:hypothetical protein